ncbi:MAG: inositol monophosphatase family protein [Gammaproteobacteria bacterium]|nr:inositol monophosphatase family protein [Gammaproteobacteria bacterium]
MHPTLNTAVKAARRAGKTIVRYFDRGDTLSVGSKGFNDFVTEVDRAAESDIMEVLRNAYPEHGILAEESGEHTGNDYQWIIDPLDGTTNFLHGFPQCAVSIALRHKSRLEQAVVFDPLRDELFTASAGDGAHLNSRRIRVSRTRKLDQSLLGTGFPFRSMEHLDSALQTMKELLPRTSGIRRPGAAALDLAYVACGRFDGFWETGLKPWDLAAGCLLIREAGGLVSDLGNGNDFLDTGGVVAGNPYIHPLLLGVVKKHYR